MRLILLDLDGDALDAPVMATFNATGPDASLRAVCRADGSWLAVTGWSAAGPVPALITPIAESNDGASLLIHGGDQGVRVAAVPRPDAPVAWSLTDTGQRAEPFLIVPPDVKAW
jgi:hypothetical protein